MENICTYRIETCSGPVPPCLPWCRGKRSWRAKPSHKVTIHQGWRLYLGPMPTRGQTAKSSLTCPASKASSLFNIVYCRRAFVCGPIEAHSGLPGSWSSSLARFDRFAPCTSALFSLACLVMMSGGASWPARLIRFEGVDRLSRRCRGYQGQQRRSRCAKFSTVDLTQPTTPPGANKQINSTYSTHFSRASLCDESAPDVGVGEEATNQPLYGLSSRR
jgi:hypothetical protein